MHWLRVMGCLYPKQHEALPDSCKTLVLLGPREPGFWPHVSRQPEFNDGQCDPLDRWSKHVIDKISHGIGGSAVYPFGGPPHAPFENWALQSGHCWRSPTQLLVHDIAGLLVSFRGAIALPVRLTLPLRGKNPCISCTERPCLDACPANAIRLGRYDISRCRHYLRTQGRKTCMVRGCAARNECPLSKSMNRAEEQSGFHMRAFMK